MLVAKFERKLLDDFENIPGNLRSNFYVNIAGS
jgi:hypothetical protein